MPPLPIPGWPVSELELQIAADFVSDHTRAQVGELDWQEMLTTIARDRDVTNDADQGLTLQINFSEDSCLVMVQVSISPGTVTCEALHDGWMERYTVQVSIPEIEVELDDPPPLIFTARDYQF